MDFEVDFRFKTQEWGTVELPASNADEAEMFAETYVKENYPDAVDIEIDGVREVNRQNG